MFYAPLAGELIGVQLAHTWGSVSCCADCGPSDWGCGTDKWFYIEMIEVGTVETWYPTTQTHGVYGLKELTCELGDPSYGCSVQYYYIDGYSGRDSEIEQ